MDVTLQSKSITVKGSKIHYLEQGAGDPILFIHGIPTSSYLWRNIIPSLSQGARCIAPDLIGMGASDKPDIDYTLSDHIEYIDAFIKKLNLKNITLVLHAWGSVIGFDYARRNPKNIKAIAFFESHVRPATDWNMLSLPVQQFATLLRRPVASYRAIVKNNYFIKKLLPSGLIRQLTEEELEAYEAPFSTPEARKPLWQYVQELPLGEGSGEDSEKVLTLMEKYSQWLQKTELPKLMLYAMPGFITTIETVQWAKDHLKNLELVCLEDVLHLAQESVPELFSQHLKQWYSHLAKSSQTACL